MPTIPFPSIPAYPGVPPIPRIAPGTPAINIAVASGNPAPNESSNELPWGIFTYPANRPLYTPTEGGTLSFFSLGYTRSMQISDFPIEANASGQGVAFASFNKVFQPANPIVMLSLGGTDAEKIAFLYAIDQAVSSTNLYNVYTPDASYTGYSIDRYSYNRSAVRGATLLMAEVSLKQILQVTASYSNSPVVSPQSPASANPVNNGITQPSAPNTSLLYDFSNSISGLVGVPR